MIDWKLSSDTWDRNELKAIDRVKKSGRYTMGAEVAEFEKQLAEMHGKKHAVMTNSGSSANLLMLSALALHPKYNTEPRKNWYGKTVRKNIIVPAVSWSTTYFPVHQNGFDLKFVDVDLDTMNIDPHKVVEAIDKDTVAVFAVNLLGNPADLELLKQICDHEDIVLLEDNCESFGALHEVKMAGSIGEMGTLSFFFSHHLQTMEGGCVFTDDDSVADYLRSLRSHGWIRDWRTHMPAKTGDPFKDSFTFVLPGYCVRPLEFSGAVGQEQLKKWDKMFKQRRANALVAQEVFDNDRISIQKETTGSMSSWFGFGVTLRGDLIGRRDEVIAALTEAGVETRPIVAGDFTKNPVMEMLNHCPLDEYPNAHHIDTNGFFFGNDCVDLTKQIKAAAKIINKL